MEPVSTKIRLYILSLTLLAVASIYINELTQYRYRWWNLLGLVVVSLILRALLFRSFTAGERRYLDRPAALTPLSWMLLLITLCILISILAG